MGYDRAEDGGVVFFDPSGERLRLARMSVKEGRVSSVAFGPGGTLAAGFYRRDDVSGGVVVLDADPASWRRKAEHVANRNFTHQEWAEFFPDQPYRRTIRSSPWPHDLPNAERKRAAVWENEHAVTKDGS